MGPWVGLYWPLLVLLALAAGDLGGAVLDRGRRRHATLRGAQYSLAVALAAALAFFTAAVAAVGALSTYVPHGTVITLEKP